MTSSPLPGDAPTDAEAIREALASWEISSATVTAIEESSPNDHWLVEVPGQAPLVLRRYRRRRTTDAVAWEHRLLLFLGERDWPVAVPIVTGGGSQLQTEAGRWALFPFMPGVVPEGDTDDQRRAVQRRGALLALLHSSLREWEHEEQRDGFGDVLDLAQPLRLDGFADFDALVGWDLLRHEDRARALEMVRAANLAAMHAGGFQELPRQAVYFQGHGEHVLFEDDTVTGLLDFDLAHRDARVADVARSLLADGWMDGWRLHAFVAGYQAHAEPPLTPAELDLLPAAMLAVEVWFTSIRLARLDRDPDPVSEALVDASIGERIPKLIEAEGELREVIRAAGGFPLNRTIEAIEAIEAPTEDSRRDGRGGT